ncbi:glycosyltransferase [Mumia zhuanghuii]|uniref:Glycosyltransferase n=2 Tax=Mumia TaxID=1546255 RepID=A0ABW1QJ74_9ACTN|nr:MULTISPECIES: glycosyltransferase [Mumia]KAA1425348.1 glycosyltransferase [Mumia zhuanghuii]
MRRRMRVRRAVAQANVAMADEAWCLTDAAAELVRAGSRAATVRVSPVAGPWDLMRHERVPGGVPRSDQVIVPGTITWYKRPDDALRWISENHDRLGTRQVLFAGEDDGSGCWPYVYDLAGQMGLTVRRQTLDRPQLYAAMRRSAAVVVPSALETLGFALSEALCHASTVVASPLASHREVANRLGRFPEWLGEGSSEHRTSEPAQVSDRLIGVQAAWVALGRSLGLPRRAGDARTSTSAGVLRGG